MPLATLAFVLVLLLAGFRPTPADAALVTVGSNAETCDYTSLAFAIAFADSGDSLEVEGKSWTHISGVNFNLFDKSLTISGGFDADCTGTDIAQPTTLRGLGDGSVLEVRSSAPAIVSLNNLVIEGGSHTHGGGLHVTGDVEIYLSDVQVQNNSGFHGAGIYLDGSGGARMVLFAGTQVLQNEAIGDGGGLQCVGGARLDIFRGVLFSYNTADNGGGLHLGDCDVTMSASGSSAQPISISDNRVDSAGGGIFVGPGGDLYADGGQNRNLTIGSNRADRGGAVALSGGTARMTRTFIFLNSASRGAAIFNESAGFHLQGTASRCALSPCNLVQSNGSLGVDGGVFWVNNGFVRLRATGVTGNTGGPIIGSLNGDSAVVLEGVELRNNRGYTGSTGFLVSGNSSVDVRGVTFADQSEMGRMFAGTGLVDAEAVIAAGVPSDLFDPQLSWDLDCAVLTAPLPDGPHPWVSNVLVTPDPGFVDRASDRRLRPGSVAIDRCGDLGPGKDAESRVRPAGLGWDAGAYELPTAIFSDGFESGDIATWSSATGT